TRERRDRYRSGEPSESGPKQVVKRLWTFLVGLLFSSLTRRIVILNVAGLVVLVAGIIQLSQFRAGLIDARVKSLEVQAEIIAYAIAAAATSDAEYGFVDLDRPLVVKPGENYNPPDEGMSNLQFSVNPERVGGVLLQLIKPTNSRARIYDRDGSLVIDSDE